MLNQKCLEILQFIRKSEDYIKLSELAEKYSVTDRTIRYDVDKIEQFLVKNGFKPFQRHHIKGIRLEQEEGLSKFIDSFINTRTPYKYSYSKEERIKFILIKLLQNNSPVKIENLTTELYTSKNTIIKDLDLLDEWLKKTKLYLIRKPRIGVWIEGEEIFRRQAISRLLSESIDIEDIVSYMSSKMVRTKINNLQFETLFSDIDVDFLNNIVVETENKLEIHFSDEAYGNLITHIAIMIKRIQLNKDIYLPEVDIKSIENEKEYIAAMDIISKIENKYKITVPDDEIGYIALHLLGSKIIKTSEEEKKTTSEENLYDIAAAMTTEIEKIYNVDFGESRAGIIEGLLMHLRPMLYRVRFNLKLANPMFDEIVHEYRELFQNTRYAARLLERYTGFPVNDQEISYITLHFGAALQNTKTRIRNKKVVVVCGTGIGTSKMVASQLESKFNVDVVATVSSRAVTKFMDKDYDLIVSTVDIPEIEKGSYIKISPLLVKKDCEKLKQYFEQKSVENDEYDENLVNRLVEIAEKYCQINDRENLQYEFCYELKNRNRNNYNIKRSIYMLNDLLTREFIKLNIDCKDWKEALKEGTNLLINQNCIEERYYDAILENFAKLGPYMVVAPGIALSHARPENGVKKLSMSLITLKNPIAFGSKTNDPVKLILTLAAIDNESHMKALVQTMELFMNNEDLEKVKNSTNKEDVLEILKKYSK